MAKITYLGSEGAADSVVWKGHVLKKGEAVEIDDEDLIAKAQGNSTFKVEGGEKAAKGPAKGM